MDESVCECPLRPMTVVTARHHDVLVLGRIAEVRRGCFSERSGVPGFFATVGTTQVTRFLSVSSSNRHKSVVSVNIHSYPIPC
jgi:hypothetical protein